MVPNKRYFPEDVVKKILVDYKDGKASDIIGNELGVTSKVILRILRENNIEIRKQPIVLTEEDKKFIIKEYNNGKPASTIAKNLGLNSCSVIKNIIKQSNSNQVLKPSTFYSRLITTEKEKEIIKDFYNLISNKEMAKNHTLSIEIIKATIIKYLYSNKLILCKICKLEKEHLEFFNKKRFVICNICRQNISIKKKNKRKEDRYEKSIKYETPRNILSNRISHSISNILKNKNIKKDTKSIFDVLGYTRDDVVPYFKSLFEWWMTFENYGIYRKDKWNDNDPATWTWQIDHIDPVSDFEYSSIYDPEFKRCWALENLRPYSSKQNQSDGTNRIRHKKKRKNAKSK